MFIMCKIIVLVFNAASVARPAWRGQRGAHTLLSTLLCYMLFLIRHNLSMGNYLTLVSHNPLVEIITSSLSGSPAFAMP